MWFKNAMVYMLLEPFNLDRNELCEKLAKCEFSPCGSLDLSRYGFVEPAEGCGLAMRCDATHGVMLCAKHEEKIMPPSAINEKLAEKVKEIGKAESRPVGRKERQILKDEIIFSMLPKAFTKSTLHYAYITADGFLVFNGSSMKKAEDFISKLREALGGLRCIPVQTQGQPAQVMTHWLRESNAPDKFELGDAAVLEASKDGRVIRVKRQDLTAAELLNLLNCGMYASSVAMVWRESVNFTLDDNFIVRGIKFGDSVLERANESSPESKAEQFKADFAVMAFELNALLRDLIDCHGGIYAD